MKRKRIICLFRPGQLIRRKDITAFVYRVKGQNENHSDMIDIEMHACGMISTHKKDRQAMQSGMIAKDDDRWEVIEEKKATAEKLTEELMCKSEAAGLLIGTDCPHHLFCINRKKIPSCLLCFNKGKHSAVGCKCGRMKKRIKKFVGTVSPSYEKVKVI